MFDEKRCFLLQRLSRNEIHGNKKSVKSEIATFEGIEVIRAICGW